MPSSRARSLFRVLVVSLLVAFTSTTLMSVLSTPEPATAQVSVGVDDGVTVRKDDDKRRKSKEDKDEQDRVLNGQVLDINTLKEPPELIVGSVDGETVVRVMKTDEIARNGIHLGDYIQADGNKVHEQLFEADQLSVSERYAAASTENDNKEKDKKK
jgi:hypothetical protein